MCFVIHSLVYSISPRMDHRKKSFALFLVFSLIVITITTLIVLHKEQNFCKSESCLVAASHLQEILDLDQSPCRSFANFHCRTIRPKNIEATNKNKLKDFFAETLADTDPKSVKLQKQFFQLCIKTRDSSGGFLKLLQELGGWPVVEGNNWNESSFDIVELMASAKGIGFPFRYLFNVSVSSMATNLLEITYPDNVQEINNLSETQYVELMTKVAVELGAHNQLAGIEMKEVVYFNNKLAKIINETKKEFTKNNNPIFTIAQIQNKWQKINWLEFLNSLTSMVLSDQQPVVFRIQNYLVKLQKLLDQTRKRTQANFFVWKIVEFYGPLFSCEIRNYLMKTPNQNLDDVCLKHTHLLLEYAAEVAFLRRFLTLDKREKIEEMVENIQNQLEKSLITAEESVKSSSLPKLQNLSYIVGGPQEMYYTEQFDKYIGIENVPENFTDLITLSVNISKLKMQKSFKQSRNYIKNMFYKLVPSTKIEYFREFNLLWIPAGILDELVYSQNSPNYLNYGILGNMIAEKIIEGVLCHSHYNTKVNCRNSQFLETAYKAYVKWLQNNSKEPKLPALGFNSQQMFWLALALPICNQILETNVTGLLQTIEAFNEDFSCKLNSRTTIQDI